MRRDLQGRAVLLTGASRGIGRALAVRLAKAGARLALTARSADQLETLAAELSRGGATAHALPADLTDAAARSEVARRAVELLGGLDVLVNNAGVASYGQFDTSTPEVLRQLMEVNFFAPAELTRECLPSLTKGRQPAVLNVASICGKRGIPAWPEHCTSKFALVGLFEALRGEFVRYGVDVLMVYPFSAVPDDVGRHLVRNAGRLPLTYKRSQTPDQVAAAAFDGLVRNRREIYPDWRAAWVARLQRWGPRVADLVLRAAVRRLYR